MQKISAATLAVVALAGAAEAGTLKFKGEGTGVVTFKVYPLANGDEVQTFESQQVNRVVDGDLKGETASGVCSGSGITTKVKPWSGQVWCTYTFNKEDAYTIYIPDDTMEGGTFTVVGGKGRFTGASGKGSYVYTWGDVVVGDRLTWAAETEIITP